MAKEIKVTMIFEAKKAAPKIDIREPAESLAIDVVTIDWTGDQHFSNVQKVGTTEEALTVGDFTHRHAVFQNLDDTNYVEIGGAAGEAYFVKLKPGERFYCPLIAVAPVAKADTAEVKLYCRFLED